MKIIIVGAGKLGNKVAGALLGSNHDITMMDISETQLKRASTQMDVMTVNANAKDIRSLKSIRAKETRFLCADSRQSSRLSMTSTESRWQAVVCRC